MAHSRFFSQIGLTAAAFLFAASLQAIAFTEPSANPPAGDVYAPLNTGPATQDKRDSSGNAAWITSDGLGSRYGALFATLGGNVGIGTTEPAVKLDVNGGVKIGHVGVSCGSALAGTFRYNSTSNKPEYCDGSAWQEFSVTAAPLTPDVYITSNTFNYNLATDLSSKGLLDGAKQYVVQINQDIFIGSTANTNPAFTTGNLPTGSTAYIINKGHIRGAGGGGGSGLLDCATSAGGGGGTALNLTVAASVDNALGTIWGGGGGGGNGYFMSGGGGAGYNGGNGGSAFGYSGQSGTLDSGGGGADQGEYTGGSGGGPAQAGSSGSAGCGNGAGGTGGKAILKNGNSVTWLGGNQTPQLKGAVQ